MTTSTELPANAPKIRVVFDSNILISAALLGLQAEYALSLAAKGSINAFISEEILNETLMKLERKFAWPATRQFTFERYLRQTLSLVKPVTVQIPRLRDASDRHVVGAAVAAGAQLIIATDRDLLTLKRHDKIGITHPKTLTWILPERE